MPHPGVGCEATGETATYRLTNSVGALLYVGMSRNPLQRWAWHAEQHPWWPDVAAYSVTWHGTRAEAEIEERRAIKEDRPVYNVHSTPRHGEVIRAGTLRSLQAARQRACEA
ncbi:GIY-YIG nuclease family protein [Streptomyces sp. 900105755]